MSRTEAVDGLRPPQAGWHWRIWGAEAAGTALLVVGALSAVAWVLGRGSLFAGWSGSMRLLLTGALVGGCVTLIAVSPMGRLSGAHINPAVTLAFWAKRMVCLHDLLGYWAAQFLGALVGGFAFRWLWDGVARSVDGGVTHPTVALGEAIALEAGMTGLVVAAIFLFLSKERLMRWTPVALGVLVGVLVWKVSPYTGTSLNPARSEGPAVAFGDLADLWLYLAAPLGGALAVAVAWHWCASSAGPMTAKLFQDPRYPCVLATRGIG